MSATKITHTEVRMYRMGTGDCFILKFFAGAKSIYTMMIDCGTWSGSRDELTPFISDLKTYVNNHVDLLVVTHEHKDHVHGFDVCRQLFTSNFRVDQVWMGWTEEDTKKKIQQWQTEYGQQKKALAVAATRLQKAVESSEFQDQLKGEANGQKMLGARQRFAVALDALKSLHLDEKHGVYAGGLEGMEIVKKELGPKKTRYFKPGDIPTIDSLPGVKFYVLGPPISWTDVKKESGGKGESYDHNKELAFSSAFADAVLEQGAGTSPFDASYSVEPAKAAMRAQYDGDTEKWRRIDHDWLFSAGSLALRVGSLTNNLSLALAIEFEDSGRVMLFPGDAEYGSWASWHTINWSVPAKDKDKHLTEDLLNRTVFYKVAHHLSHNGTARRLGLEMLKHPDLTAMATLDYEIISPGWTSTMPNRAIVAELLARTKGRLIVMNEKGPTVDKNKTVKLADKVAEARAGMSEKEKAAFAKDYSSTHLYHQYIVRA